MKNIFVAVDGSEASREALSMAADISLCQKARLTGVFIVDSEWPDYIGNDWQSSRNSRQTFLDYIHAEQEEQAESARIQFEKAAKKLKSANFKILAGDPTKVMTALSENSGVDLLIFSRRVFQISGRPSLKSLVKKISAKATRPIVIFQ